MHADPQFCDFFDGLGGDGSGSEGVDLLGYVVRLFVGEVVGDGQAETFEADALGDGEATVAMAETGVGLVKVQGHRVVDGVINPIFLEVGHEIFTVFGANGELVPGGDVAFSDGGESDFGVAHFGEVDVGEFASSGVPVFELGPLGAQDGGLELGEAAGVADFVVVVAFTAHAVDAETPGAPGDFVVIGDDEASVASGTEVFGDVEAESGGHTEFTGELTVTAGGDGLGGVFEDHEAVLGGDGVDRFHVGELAEEVDGENRLGFWGDGGFDEVGVDVEGVFDDVDEDGYGPELDHGFDGCDEGEGGGDDFVPGADAAGLHGDAEGVGSAVDGDGVFDVVRFRDVLFELFVVLAEDVGSGGEDLGDGRINQMLDFVVLTGEIQERHAHGSSLTYAVGG